MGSWGFKGLMDVKLSCRIKRSLSILKKIHNDWNDPECKVMTMSILKGLIKGLEACGENSRKGYYSTLIAIQTLFPSHLITFDEFVNLVESELCPTGDIAEEEETKLLAATILAYGSLIHTNKLKNESKENQKLVIKKLLYLSSKHIFLKSISYFFTIQHLSQVSKELYFDIIETLLRKDFKNSKNCFSLDQLYCLFVVKELFPSTKLVENIIDTSDLIHENSMEFIISTLMNVPSSSFITHPCYDTFCSQLVLNEHLLQVYWKNINRQIKTGSDITECVVLQLLYRLLGHLSNDLVKHVPLLMRKELINLILQKKYAHHELIKKNLERLESCVRSAGNDVKLLLLERLLLYPGVLNFDCLSGSNIVKKITHNLDSEGVMLLSSMYCDVLSGQQIKKCNLKKKSDSGVEWTNKDIRLTAVFYGKLISHSSCYNNIDWRQEQVLKLVAFGFFKSNENISPDSAGIVRNIFFGSLNHKFPRLQDHINVLMAVVKKINKNLNKGVPPQVTFRAKTFEVWKCAINKAMSLSTVNEYNNFQHGKVFKIILIHMALMLWKDPEAGRNSLQELYSIMNRISSNLKTNGPHWSEVLVDLLLHLLSTNNGLYRNTVKCVFEDVCTDLNQNAIRQIVKVLDPKFKYEDMNTEGNETFIKSEIILSENGYEKCNETESSSNGDSSDDGNNGSEVSRPCATSFPDIATNSDNESIDMDEINDEDGELLNMALSQLMKTQIAAKAKKNLNFEDPLTHFRIRALDLVEILFENHPSLTVVLDIIPTLFDLLEYCIKLRKQEALYSRLRSCFNKLSSVKKCSGFEEVDDTLFNKLKNLLNKNNRPTPVLIEMTPQIVDCYKYFFRLSTSGNSNNNWVNKILLDELQSFYEKRNNTLVYNIIKTAITVSWEGIITLMPHITKLAFSHDVKHHKRYDIIILLDAFVKNGRIFNEETVNIYTAEFNEMREIIFQQAIEVLQRIGKKQVFLKYDTAILNILCTLHKNNFFSFNWKDIRSLLIDSIYSSDIKALNKILKKLSQLLNVSMEEIHKSESLKAFNSNLEAVANAIHAEKRKKKAKHPVEKKKIKI